MKKLITFLICATVVSVAISQTAVIPKQNVAAAKGVSGKSLLSKVVPEKDSIKKDKGSIDLNDKKTDSVVAILGTFKAYKKEVHASYYADMFNGRRTSSGKRFDNSKYTAAHKKLPFGTKVRVTNEKNGKSVIVEITDRGPFVRSREIDLSKRAFMDIASNRNSGGMLVTLEVLTK